MAEGRSPFGRGNLSEWMKREEPCTSRARGRGDLRRVESRLPRGRANIDILMKNISELSRQGTVQSPSSESTPEAAESQSKRSEDITQRFQSITIKEEETGDSKSERVSDVKKGEYGDKVLFSTNYIRLRTDKEKRMYEYVIKFEPQIDNVQYRFKLLYSEFREKREILCFDGGTKLFTPEIITKGVAKYNLKHPNGPPSVCMIITFIREAKPKDCAVVYNTLFKNFSRLLSMTRFKNKFYDHRASLKLPQHKLEVWPGVITSVEDFDGGIQLRCDLIHRVLRLETPLEVIINAINNWPEKYKDVVSKELLGQCVSTYYNNSLYRIDDLDWSQTPLSSFKLSSGSTITYVEYYKRQYNIDIKNLNQPLLINRAKGEKALQSRLICLIPELCNLTGLTDKMRADHKVMKDIAIYTKVSASQRVYAFRKYLNDLKNNSEVQKILLNWGLSIDDEAVCVRGRNLLQERLIFGNDARITVANGEWHRELRDVIVYRSVSLQVWCLFVTKKDFPIAQSFVNMLRKVGPGLGIDISSPKMVILNSDKSEAYVSALRANLHRLVQMVVCICPSAREDRYSAIKKFCCVEFPIPSQVINSITLSREERLRIVVQNVALQMNAKLGGATWTIHIPFKNTMVCGIDTYHGAYERSSVGGFVASCEATYSEWYSKTILLGPKEEFITGLISCFEAALKYYIEKNGEYPERIVVYRDGLGDGQLDVCMEYEVAHMIKTCEKLTGANPPKFTFVVVRKRIQTKIFRAEEADSGKLETSQPGDVIDQTITRRKFFDFFLVSQHVRYSTANPCHFLVIYDNSSIKADHIQRLTYKFCHLYYNWAGTIRVPAPCFYAHKLAFLVGQYVQMTPDRRMDNMLYYL